MTTVLSVLCALFLLPIVLAYPNSTNVSVAAIDPDAKPVSTMNLATLLDAAFQKNNIDLSDDVVDETYITTSIDVSTTVTEGTAKQITTGPMTTATTTGNPSEELIPPALVNATIAQMHNKQTHRTGQIVIT